MNDDDKFIHKYYAPFPSSNNHENVYSGSDYNSEKRKFCRHKNITLDLLLNESNIFEW